MPSTHLAFAIDGGGGNLTYQRNLASALEGVEGVVSDFLLIPIGRHDRWDRLPLLGRNLALTASARAAAALYATHRRRRIDAAMIHSQSLAHFALELMRRVPTLISTDGTPANYDSFAHELDHQIHGPAVEGAKKIWTKAIFRGARRILAFSAWVKDSLINDYGCPDEKVVVIPSGIDIERWKPGAERRPDDGKIRILFTGGNFERKGGPELMQWHARTRHRHVELHLVTQQPVPEQPGVIVHRSMVPNSPELIGLAQRCDLFVLPTRGDCFPFAVIEAQAAGLPAVVSNVGGISNIVVDGETGFLVPPREADALAERIDLLVEDAGLRHRLGARARERVVERFDARINSRRILDLMIQMAEA